jgi:DNA-binding response OmpR family regulator
MFVGIVWGMVPRKILVVDDEPDLVELVAFNLEAEGYQVITATNGMEALNRARAILPDLIVLDLMLPELDGLSVCEILHRLPSTAPIPIIILTAWKSEITRVIGLEAGANEYVTKPFSPRELVLRVNKTLKIQDEKAGDMLAGE